MGSLVHLQLNYNTTCKRAESLSLGDLAVKNSEIRSMFISPKKYGAKTTKDPSGVGGERAALHSSRASRV